MFSAATRNVRIRAIPFGITIFTSQRAIMNLLATINTCWTWFSNRRIPAFSGAILDHLMNCFARIKRTTTILTNNGATCITNQSSARTRLKLLSTLYAISDWNTIWKTTIRHQFGMFFPKLCFYFRMTCGAKCYEIRNLIRLRIMTKQTKRYLVMYRKTFTNNSTILTRVIVSLPCNTSLLIPVSASIPLEPATPRRIVFTIPLIGISPNDIALSTAEIMNTNSRWSFLETISTSRTNNRYAFAPLSFAMRFLPFSITFELAKRIYGFISLIARTFKYSLALCAFKFSHLHILIIAMSGLLSRKKT